MSHPFALPARVVVLGAGSVLALAGCGGSTDASNERPSGSANPPAQILNAASGNFADANGMDLKGDWKSTEREAWGPSGAVQGTETLTITEQHGAIFVVARDLELTQAVKHDSGTPVQKVTDQPLLGVVNVDGSVTMVKTGDSGRLEGRLIDANTMVVTYSEAGEDHAVARIRFARATPAATGGTGTTAGSTNR